MMNRFRSKKQRAGGYTTRPYRGRHYTEEKTTGTQILPLRARRDRSKKPYAVDRQLPAPEKCSLGDGLPPYGQGPDHTAGKSYREILGRKWKVKRRGGSCTRPSSGTLQQMHGERYVVGAVLCFTAHRIGFSYIYLNMLRHSPLLLTTCS